MTDAEKIDYLEGQVAKLNARIRELEGAEIERVTEALEAMNVLGATDGESLLKVAYRASEQLSMMNAALAAKAS